MGKKFLRGILILSILFITFLSIGCNQPADNKEGDKDIEQNIERKVADYFPVAANTKYTYEGTGNEFAGYTSYTDYSLEDKVQYVKNNGGTNIVQIISVKDGQVTSLYNKGEIYYREDYLRNPTLVQYDDNEILLKEPLEVGTSWTLKDDKTASITSVDKEVETGYGKFQAVEVTKDEKDGSKTVSYYAKGTGLIKTEYIMAGGDKITSSLKKVESNYANSFNIKFYYPNSDDYKLYYIDKNISYHTNDITRKLIEEAYKTSLTQSMKDKGLIAVLTPNTKINYLYLTKSNVVRVDLSFDLIKEMNLGSGLESSVLKGITATLAGYYNTDRINLTIDNNNYSSGHIYLNNNQYLYADFSQTQEFK